MSEIWKKKKKTETSKPIYKTYIQRYNWTETHDHADK